MRLTDGLSGGRDGGTRGAHQAHYRAASLPAAAGRPSAAAGVGQWVIFFVLFWFHLMISSYEIVTVSYIVRWIKIPYRAFLVQGYSAYINPYGHDFLQVNKVRMPGLKSDQ